MVWLPEWAGVYQLFPLVQINLTCKIMVLNIGMLFLYMIILLSSHSVIWKYNENQYKNAQIKIFAFPSAKKYFSRHRGIKPRTITPHGGEASEQNISWIYVKPKGSVAINIVSSTYAVFKYLRDNVSGTFNVILIMKL